MPIFTRSKPRENMSSRNWLSGIGNWKLGLYEDDQLISNSNAIMIDRSEPDEKQIPSWMIPIPISASRNSSDDSNKRNTNVPLQLPEQIFSSGGFEFDFEMPAKSFASECASDKSSTNDSVLLKSVESVARPGTGITCPDVDDIRENTNSKKRRMSLTKLVSEADVSGDRGEASGSSGSKLKGSSSCPSLSAPSASSKNNNMRSTAAAAAAATGTEQAPAIAGAKNGISKGDPSCVVADHSEDGSSSCTGNGGRSQGVSPTRIEAKPEQGEEHQDEHGGRPQSPIGLPLTPPHLHLQSRATEENSSSGVGSKAGGVFDTKPDTPRASEERERGENKQDAIVPPPSFFISHTTKSCSPSQNKNGDNAKVKAPSGGTSSKRDASGSHTLVAVVSSSASGAITDNGPYYLSSSSFSKGSSSSSSSSSLLGLHAGAGEDPLLSSSCSDSDFFICMNDAEGVYVSGNNKTPQAPSSALLSSNPKSLLPSSPETIILSDRDGLTSSSSTSDKQQRIANFDAHKPSAIATAPPVTSSSSFQYPSGASAGKTLLLSDPGNTAASHINSGPQAHLIGKSLFTVQAQVNTSGITSLHYTSYQQAVLRNSNNTSSPNPSPSPSQTVISPSTTGGDSTNTNTSVKGSGPHHHNTTPFFSTAQLPSGPKYIVAPSLTLLSSPSISSASSPPPSTSNFSSSSSSSSYSSTAIAASSSSSSTRTPLPLTLTLLSTSPTNVFPVSNPNPVPLLSRSSPGSPTTTQSSPIGRHTHSNNTFNSYNNNNAAARARDNLQQIQYQLFAPELPPIPKEYRPISPVPAPVPFSKHSPEGSSVNEVARSATVYQSSFPSSNPSSTLPQTSATFATQPAFSPTSSINSKSLAMAARSAAAQKSLMKKGAVRDTYAPYHHPGATVQHHGYNIPNQPLDTAPSSNNSSGEFQAENDIHTLQAMARKREQDEANGRGRAGSASRMQGNYVKGHRKNGSGNEVLENVFGIYPEKKSMGTGVSVADVVANKLFKWGNKKEAPSTIPVPSRDSRVPPQRPSKNQSIHPGGFVGGYSPQPMSPYEPHPRHASSQMQHVQEYHHSQRETVIEEVHSPKTSNLDQVKLDELMARQRLLEDRINQLRLERDHLLDINAPPANVLPLKPHHEAAIPVHQNYPQVQMGHPQRVQSARVPSAVARSRSPEPNPSHCMSSAVAARQLVEPISSPIQFPLPPQQHAQSSPQIGSTSPGKPRTSRAFPPSKHIQPLKTTPMAIPSAVRPATSNGSAYASRPLPQPPIDATPPPEYEPPELPYPARQSSQNHHYRDMKIKLTSPTSGTISTQDVILEEPIPHPVDEKHLSNIPSPRDEVDAEDILGWFETLKFASTGPRGRGPMAPLPRPEAVESSLTPPTTADGKIGPRNAITGGYFDVKLPIAANAASQAYDAKKDWNAGRKKRSETRMRETTREIDAIHVAPV